MGAAAEYNLKDMTFHEIRNVILHYMNDTGELPEFPWQEVPHVLSDSLAFVAGLFWYSNHTRRIRYTGTDHDNSDPDATVTYSVPRIHNFTQGVLTDTWEIEHNFETFKPAVFVFDDDDNALDAAITHVDENNTTITFTSAITGYAILIG